MSGEDSMTVLGSSGECAILGLDLVSDVAGCSFLPT